MRRWNLIFRVFVAEYLNLRPATVFGPPRREDLVRHLHFASTLLSHLNLPLVAITMIMRSQDRRPLH